MFFFGARVSCKSPRIGHLRRFVFFWALGSVVNLQESDTSGVFLFFGARVSCKSPRIGHLRRFFFLGARVSCKSPRIGHLRRVLLFFLALGSVVNLQESDTSGVFFLGGARVSCKSSRIGASQEAEKAIASSPFFPSPGTPELPELGDVQLGDRLESSGALGPCAAKLSAGFSFDVLGIALGLVDICQSGWSARPWCEMKPL